MSKGIADDFDSLTNLLDSLAGDLDAEQKKFTTNNVKKEEVVTRPTNSTQDELSRSSRSLPPSTVASVRAKFDLPVKQNSSDFVHLSAIPPPTSPLASSRSFQEEQKRQEEEKARKLEEQRKLDEIRRKQEEKRLQELALEEQRKHEERLLEEERQLELLRKRQEEQRRLEQQRRLEELQRMEQRRLEEQQRFEEEKRLAEQRMLEEQMKSQQQDQSDNDDDIEAEIRMLEEQNRIEEERLQEEKRKWEELQEQRKARERASTTPQRNVANQYDELLDMEEQAWKEKRRQEEEEWANKRRAEEEKFNEEQRQRKDYYSTLSKGSPSTSRKTPTLDSVLTTDPSQVVKDLSEGSRFDSVGRSGLKPVQSNSDSVMPADKYKNSLTPSQSASDPNIMPKYGSFGKNTFKRTASRDLEADILSSLDPIVQKQEEERRGWGKDTMRDFQKPTISEKNLHEASMNKKYGSFGKNTVKNKSDGESRYPIPNLTDPPSTRGSTDSENPYTSELEQLQMELNTQSSIESLNPEDMPSYEDFMGSFSKVPKDPEPQISPRVAKLRRPITVSPRGISTRNIDELHRKYRQESMESLHSENESLSKVEHTPSNPVSSSATSIEELEQELEHECQHLEHDYQDEDELSDNSSSMFNSAIQEALSTLGSIDPYTGEQRDDEFVRNFEHFASSFAAARVNGESSPETLSKIPSPLVPGYSKQSSQPRVESIPPQVQPSKSYEHATIGIAKPRNTRPIMEFSVADRRDSATLRSPSSRRDTASNNVRRLDVDDIISNRAKIDSLRSAMLAESEKKMIKQELLDQLSKPAPAWDDGSALAVNRNRSLYTPSSEPGKVHVRKPSAHLPPVILTIYTVDESSKKIVVTSDFTIQDVIYSFAEKLSLWQIEYFSLANRNADGSDRWLNPHSSLDAEHVTTNSKLFFKLRFFKQPKKLVDPAAIHLYYIQVYQFIRTGYYRVPVSVGLKLAAFQLQIIYGDNDKAKHRIGFFDAATLQAVVPESVRKSLPVEYVEQQVFSLHAKLKGLQKAEAKLKYLTEAKKLTVYGVTLFEVIESGMARILGVAEDGVMISVKDNKDAYDLYHFSEISGWAQTKYGIEIRINNPNKKPLFELSTPNGEEISELMAGYFTLLRYQVVGTSNYSIGLPSFSHPLPDHQLFLLPSRRQVFDPHYSRLELFRSVYLDETSKARSDIVLKLMHQLDNHLALELPNDKLSPEVLDLSNSGMNDAQLQVIADSFTRTFKYVPRVDNLFVENMDIKDINLSNNTLTPEAAAFVGLIIEAPLPFKSFNLAGMNMGLKGAKLLASYLERDNRLEKISVANNNLTSKGIIPIFNAIKKNRKYTSLDFSWNGFDDKVIEPLLDLLQTKASLAELRVGGNKIGDSGVKAILVALRKQSPKYMQVLDVSDTGISSSTKYVVEWLCENHQVEKLYIAKSKMSEKVSLHLAKTLADSKLTVLDLRACFLDNKPLKQICNQLLSNRKLQELYLSGNVIKKKTGEILCQSLEQNTTLTTLALRNCSLGKSTAIALLKVLKKSKDTGLKVVDMALNPDIASTEVVETVEEMLTTNKILEDFNLSACKLTGKYLQPIVAGVARNTGLKVLRLDANKIGKDVSKIASAIKQPSNNKLEELTFRKCEISAKHLDEFFSSLGPNTQLTRIVLEKNEALDKSKFSAYTKQCPNLVIKV